MIRLLITFFFEFARKLEQCPLASLAAVVFTADALKIVLKVSAGATGAIANSATTTIITDPTTTLTFHMALAISHCPVFTGRTIKGHVLNTSETRTLGKIKMGFKRNLGKKYE